jgi:hypothetical protein
MRTDLSVGCLRKLMRHRKKPMHLILDSLPAHKSAAAATGYADSTEGKIEIVLSARLRSSSIPTSWYGIISRCTGTAKRPLALVNRCITASTTRSSLFAIGLRWCGRSSARHL